MTVRRYYSKDGMSGVSFDHVPMYFYVHSFLFPFWSIFRSYLQFSIDRRASFCIAQAHLFFIHVFLRYRRFYSRCRLIQWRIPILILKRYVDNDALVTTFMFLSVFPLTCRCIVPTCMWKNVIWNFMWSGLHD